jgi:hypothetical protein
MLTTTLSRAATDCALAKVRVAWEPSDDTVTPPGAVGDPLAVMSVTKKLSGVMAAPPGVNIPEGPLTLICPVGPESPPLPEVKKATEYWVDVAPAASDDANTVTEETCCWTTAGAASAADPHESTDAATTAHTAGSRRDRLPAPEMRLVRDHISTTPLPQPARYAGADDAPSPTTVQ